MLASEQFTFIVGAQRTVFRIHARAATRQSQVLVALINAPLREAQDGFVEWGHVDADVFAAFAQVGYADTYTTNQTALVTSVPDDTFVAGLPWEEMRNAINERHSAKGLFHK